MRKPRILLAGLFHETHNFTEDVTRMADFAIRRGDEVLARRAIRKPHDERKRPDIDDGICAAESMTGGSLPSSMSVAVPWTSAHTAAALANTSS